MANGQPRTETLSRNQRQGRRQVCPGGEQTATPEVQLLQDIFEKLDLAFGDLKDTRIQVFNEDPGTEEVLRTNEQRVGFVVHNDTVDSELLIRLGQQDPAAQKYTDRIAPGETREYSSGLIGRWKGRVKALWRGPNVQSNSGQGLFTELIQ